MVGEVLGSGGQIRVGMEDSIYLGPGELARSDEQIGEKTVRIICGMGSNCRVLMRLGKG